MPRAGSRRCVTWSTAAIRNMPASSAWRSSCASYATATASPATTATTCSPRCMRSRQWIVATATCTSWRSGCAASTGCTARWRTRAPGSSAATCLRGADLCEEAPDLALEAFGFRRKRLGQRFDFAGGGARVLRAAGHAAHRLGAGTRIAGCPVDALGYRRHGGVLLLDRGRHGGGDARHVLDDLVDLLDRLR